MNQVAQVISKSIKEAKWVSIKYKNQNNEHTFFWIAVTSIINIEDKILGVSIFNETKGFDTIEDGAVYFDSILDAYIIEGTTYDVPSELIYFINKNDNKLKWLGFNNNLNNILDYFIECSKYDNEPSLRKHSLLDGVDVNKLMESKVYELSPSEMEKLIADLKRNNRKKRKKNIPVNFYELIINVLAIKNKNNENIYVIAYYKVDFNPSNKSLVINNELHFNKRFILKDSKVSLYNYIDDVDAFIRDYKTNPRAHNDELIASLSPSELLEALPFLAELGRIRPIDYESEFAGLKQVKDKNELSNPLKALFGLLSRKNLGRKESDIVLINHQVNIDQLATIHNSLKNPLTYVQGPPGTGKTNTILHILISALFNDMTVLVSSNNNKAVDNIYQILSRLEFEGKLIPLPIIRLGNNNEVADALDIIKETFQKHKNQIIFDDYIIKHTSYKVKQYEKVNNLLDQYYKKEDLIAEKKALEQTFEYISKSKDLEFRAIALKTQISSLEGQINTIPDLKLDDVLKYLNEDISDINKILYYSSIKRIQLLKADKYKPLLEILNIADSTKKVQEFNRYLRDDKNLRDFLKVYPIILTTNMSALKLGSPKPHFDLTIIDEAGQCVINSSLLPIMRGKRLLLLGDQNQLEPIVLLDENINKKLMYKYDISSNYNYLNNSILKAMLNNDHVSRFILLRTHYRCHPDIIKFSSQRYYNDELIIKSKVQHLDNSALELVDIPYSPPPSALRNTNIAEAEYIVNAIKDGQYSEVAVITPFRNQAKLINDLLEQEGIDDVEVGTIHSFQGDEKEKVFLSLVINSRTPDRTLGWVKNNRELINVATTRAKKSLVVTSNYNEIKSRTMKDDDVNVLLKYMKDNGDCHVKSLNTGYLNRYNPAFKTYNTKAEEEFLGTITFLLSHFKKYIVKEKVKISTVLNKDFVPHLDYYFMGEFDFVIYEENSKMPVCAIEIDGIEHFIDPIVKARDKKKEEICQAANLHLVRIPNDYVREYYFVRDYIVSLLKD